MALEKTDAHLYLLQFDDIGSELAFKLAGTLEAEIKQQEQPPTTPKG